MTEPNREREIFEAALELPTDEERRAYVEAACGDDQALAERMVRLLAPDDDERFLPDHPEAETSEVSLAEGPGTVIDRYKLLEQIGEGGFGVVYMAEQLEPVKRRVALKIIKPGMDSKQVIARFEAERQALAMMDHPNIAQVHDAGATESGRPYFVMELVQGIPVTTFCREQKLGLKKRLNLFIDVCNAVQHAHQKGIIHRDLKPTNILVTLHGDQPVPKVIDFGIAKATAQPLTEQTLFTQFQQFLGTPAYMSPEQAALSGLDVDTRSDVYSLGVLLYELLTGSPPFDSERLLSAGLDEMRRILREEEPQKPSTKISQSRTKTEEAGRTVPPAPDLKVTSELDWIVLKALEKDRDRRYETANGLAADLRRYLDDEPVTAVAPSFGYQLRKFARRHRSAIGFTAVIAFLLVGAAVVSSLLAMRAFGAEREATRLLQEAQEARDEAEEISKFMSGIFQTPKRGEDGELVTAAEILRNAEEELERKFAENPERREILRVELASAYSSMGLARRAIPIFEEVFTQRETRLGPEHPDTVEIMAQLGEALGRDGQYARAIEINQALSALCRKIHGPKSDQVVGTLVSLSFNYLNAGMASKATRLSEQAVELSESDSGETTDAMLAALLVLQQSYESLGRIDDSLEISEKVLKLSKDYSSEALQAAQEGHAGTLLAAGRFQESIDLLREVVDSRKATYHADDPALLRPRIALALALCDGGYPVEALGIAEDVVALSTRTLGASHPETWVSMSNLATIYTTLGRYFDALELNKKLVDQRRERLGADHPKTLISLTCLAVNHIDMGSYQEAVEILEKVVALRRERDGPKHRDLRTAINNLAVAYSNMENRLPDAARLLEEALAAPSASAEGEIDFWMLHTMVSLSGVYSKLGRDEEAVELLNQVIGEGTRSLHAYNPAVLRAKLDLARHHWRAGRRTDAIAMCAEVIAESRATLGDGHPVIIGSRRKLAQFYQEQQRHDLAVKVQQELVDSLRVNNEETSDRVIREIAYLANYCHSAGRHREAVQHRRHILAQRTKSCPPGDSRIARAYADVGFALDLDNRKDEAIDMWQKAVEIDATLADVQFWLGKALFDSKRHDEALAPLRAASELCPEPDRVADSLGRLAAALDSLGRPSELDDLPGVFERRLATRAEELGEDHPETLRLRAELALMYLERGLGEEFHRECLKLAELARSFEIPESTQPEDPPPGDRAQAMVESLEKVGNAAARRRCWGEAKLCFGAKLRFPHEPDDLSMTRMRQAVLMVMDGDLAAYREFCGSVRQSIGDNPPQATAERFIKSCLISRPDAAAEIHRHGLELGERHRDLIGSEAADHNCWMNLTLGLIACRKQEFAAAQPHLLAADEDAGGWEACRAAARCLLAMTYHHTGDSEKAREALDAAAKQWDAVVGQEEGATLPDLWHDWLIVELLRQEAEALLNQ